MNVLERLQDGLIHNTGMNFSFIVFFIIFPILKARGGIFFPFGGDGKKLLELGKFLQRIGFKRRYSLLFLFEKPSETIAYEGKYKTREVRVELVNRYHYESIGEVLNTSLTQLAKGVSTIITEKNTAKRIVLSQESISIAELQNALDTI